MGFAAIFGSLARPAHSVNGKPNEDASAIVFGNSYMAAAIFDGVGGLPNGSMASHLAAAEFVRIGEETLVNPLSPSASSFLPDIFHKIHADIQLIDAGCCTTATAALFGISPNNEERIIALVLSVGDSRLYIFVPQSGELTRATRDDVPWSESSDACRILDEAESPKDLGTLGSWPFRNRNVISSALGGDHDIHPTLTQVQTSKSAWFIFTTDGVHDNLTTSEIKQILLDAEGDPVKANDSLLQAAYNRSQDQCHLRHKEDDITVGIVFLLDN